MDEKEIKQRNNTLIEDSEIEKEGSERKTKTFRDRWEGIVRLGLGEASLRFGTAIASVALVLLVVWVMGKFYLQGDLNDQKESAAMAAALPTPTQTVVLPEFEMPVVEYTTDSLTRYASLHTTLPEKPRYEITTYVVQSGDTVFGIADKFGLKPQTIFWGNYDVLADDPHRLKPGQELNILPLDGLLYEWHAGDGLNGVSSYFKVTPEDIINWPGNNLDPETIGDFASPNIEPGTKLFVPGGTREYITWSAPRITRSDPAVAKVMGPGYCGVITDGAVGNGTFIWPSTSRYISGYDYSPDTNHFAIDIGGSLGNAIYASDNGVVVYSGWNDWGYGYMIVIDHGNGWQTLYAHLSTIYAGCGASVFQGDTIGLMGSTGNSSGPHLHFEMRSDTYGRPDPKQFLQ